MTISGAKRNEASIVTQCNHERLRKYAEATCSDDDRHATDAHLLVCAACQRDLREIEELHDAFVLREVDTGIESPNIERSTRIESNIRDLVETVLREPPASWGSAFAARSGELHTVAATRALLDWCDDAYYNLPATSYLEIASFTVEVAEAASAAAPYPRRSLVAEALKEKSTALRLRGRFAEAMKSLAQAEREVRAGRTSLDEEATYDIAQIRFARSIILTEMERPAEAMPDLLAARAHFAESNFNKYTATFFQEAAMLQRQGDIPAAIALFETLIAEAIERDHSGALSDLYGGIARCFAQAGEHWTACEYIARAKAEAIAGGDLSIRRALQLAWTLATSLSSAGRHDEAFAAYEEAKVGYYQLGYDSSAIKVEIDMALARRRANPDDDLYEYFVGVCSRAQQSGAQVRAAHVVDELRTMAARRRLSTTVLEYAKSYMEDVATCPDLQFCPPVSDSSRVFLG
jgi:tetratricopeptide (TPR) repeat protein